MKLRNPAWGCPRIAQQITLSFVGGKARMVKAVQDVEGGLADAAGGEEVAEDMAAEQQHELAGVEGGDRFRAFVGGSNSAAGAQASLPDNPVTAIALRSVVGLPNIATLLAPSRQLIHSFAIP